MPTPFEPIAFGGLEISNRMVRAACGERRADREGRVGHEMLSYVDAIARGGSGMVILGHGYIRTDGRLTDNETGLDSDGHVPRLGLVAQQVQRAGARAPRSSSRLPSLPLPLKCAKPVSRLGNSKIAR